MCRLFKKPRLLGPNENFNWIFIHIFLTPNFHPNFSDFYPSQIFKKKKRTAGRNRSMLKNRTFQTFSRIGSDRILHFAFSNISAPHWKDRYIIITCPCSFRKWFLFYFLLFVCFETWFTVFHTTSMWTWPCHVNVFVSESGTRTYLLNQIDSNLQNQMLLMSLWPSYNHSHPFLWIT